MTAPRPDLAANSRSQLARFGSVGLFAGAPVLGALAPLVLTIVVTRTLGAPGWASLALALAIGNASSTIAELGWGVVGSQRIARHPDDRQAIYRTALASKLAALAVIAPGAAVIAWALAPADPFGAALISVGAASAALSPAWFFVGAGRPGLTLLCDAVPRLVLSVVAAALISIGASLAVYGAGLILSTMSAWVLAAAIGGLPWLPRKSDLRAAPMTIHRQVVVVAGRAVSVLYTTIPSVILGALAPGAVALYAAVDRPLRMGVVVLGAIPARLQSYLGVVERDVARRRSVMALCINAGMGLAAGTIFLVGMPLVWNPLYGNAVPLDFSLIALGSGLVALMCSSRGLGIVLVALDAAGDITRAVVTAAGISLAGVPLLAAAYGAHGALIGVLCAELAGVAVQAWLVRGRWHSSPAPL